MITKICKVGADWCGPCRMLKSELKKFNLVPIVEIDADENEDFCKQNNITTIPVILFYDNDTVVDRHVGFINNTELINKINQLNEIN